MRAMSLVPCVLLAFPVMASVPPAPVSPEGDPSFNDACPQSVTYPSPVRLMKAAGQAARLDEVTFLSTDDAPDGDSTRDIVFTPDGLQAVMINAQTNNMTFLNVATRTVTHSVPVGEYPVHLAVTPDGRYAVSANVFSNSVTVVDVASHAVVAEIPVTGDQPYRVAITPDSRYAVVGVIQDAIISTFSVIDLDTMTEAYWFDSASQGATGGYFTPEYGIFGDSFTQFALTPDGSRIVYPSRGDDTIYIYDVATGTELAALGTFDQPAAVDVAPNGAFAAVSCEGTSRRVVKVDLATNTIAASFATTADLMWQKIRVTPDSQYAITSQLNEIEFVNMSTGALTRLSTGTPGDIEFSFDGLYAFVSNFSSRVINLATRTQVASVTYAASAEAATSPTAPIAVALNNRFGEDVHVYNIAGPASSFLGATLTGLPKEGDSTRSIDLAPDGRTLFVSHATSSTATFVDLSAQAVSPLIDTAFRTLDAAVSPDGLHAVTTNADGQTVSIIDVPSQTRVAELSITDRPSRVRISPDSSHAYVLTLAGTDRIHKIALNGASSSVVGSQLAGQTGAVGFGFSEFSAIELSPDGSLLAVCRSFDDIIRLIDTGTMAIVADVSVDQTSGTDFPLRIAFNPAGTRAYVTNAFANSVSVINVNGAASTAIATVPNMNQPVPLVVDDAGDYVYVGTSTFNAGGIKVIDAATNTVVRTIVFPNNGAPRELYLSPVDGMLYAAGADNNEGKLWILNAAGASTSLDRTITLSAAPADLAFSETLGQAIVSLPVPDGIDIVQVRDVCTADFNQDGTVDILDFLDFFDSYSPCDGQPAPCGTNGNNADYNGDTVVDILDFLDFMDAFGDQSSGPCAI